MTIPARFSDRPFPCTVEILREWLNRCHGFDFAEGARLMGGVNSDYLILQQVQERYGKAVPTENENGTPWPSEVWAAVVTWEREAGQPSLFEAETTVTPIPPDGRLWMARKKKSTDGFGFGQCSLCDHMRLTLGQQAFGGIRYCADCIKHTLMWVQTSEADQTKLMERYAELEARPDIKAAMAIVAAVPEGKRAEIEKANSIGESRNRLFTSGEHDGTEFLPPGWSR